MANVFQGGTQPSIQGTLATAANWASIFSVPDVRFKQEFAQAAYDLFGGQEEANLMDILSQLGASMETTTADTISWFEKGRVMPVVAAGEGDYTSVVKASDTKIDVVGELVPWSVGDELLLTTATEQELVKVTALDADRLGATVVGVANSGRYSDILDATEVIITIAGNDQDKGSSAPDGSPEIQTQQYSNMNNIARRSYNINNSDKSSLAWFQLDGQDYWTNADMENQFKLFKMVKEQKSLVSEGNGSTTGMQGLLPAMRARGNNYDGHPTTLDNWETIIKQIDTVGGRPEYMALLSRAAAFATSRAMAEFTPTSISHDGSTTVTGENYGSFSNGQKLLSIGFDGFDYGTFKVRFNTWGALTTPTSSLYAANRLNEIHGLMMPMGNTAVSMNGSVSNVPYLSVLHKVGNGQNRELVTGLTGWDTNAVDETRVHWLSEWTTRLACANKAFLFEDIP